MIEEVKKIARAMITASHYNNLPEASFESYIREICQLFEPKPDEGRLLTDEVLAEIFVEVEKKYGYQKTPKDFGHIRNEASIKNHYEAIIAKTASILKKKYEADMKHLLHLIDDVFELEKKVKSKDAECQERVDKLIASYTEYIEARKSDLTGMPSRSIPHSMALQVRRDTLDFALKAFIELANK